MERLPNLAGHLVSLNVSAKCSDDVVICSAVRTPVTKATKGYLKDTAPEVMLSHVLKAAAQRANMLPEEAQDIVVGCNLQPGAG
jgi:acetyl-CoA acyltransferase 1